MPLVRLLAICLCAMPCTAAAQPWADAYRSRDYQKAADLLHPIVTDPEGAGMSDDPEPARHLALMYANGLGVPRDSIGACALAQLAEMATHLAAPRYAQSHLAYKAAMEETERFTREHCDGLTRHQRLAASRSMGCFAFGMPEESLTFGEHTVRVGRNGIGLSQAEEEAAAPDLGCPVVVVRMRPLTLAPPADAAPGVIARDFVELVGWQPLKSAADPALQYFLTWQLFEVQGKKVTLAARELLVSTPVWPRAAAPPEFDARFSMEMIRSGHVRWRFEDAPPKRGWIMRPDERPR
jgi:hypothetical protein